MTEDGGELYLIVSVDSGEPPSPFQVSNTTAYFEPTPEITTLDYVNPFAGHRTNLHEVSSIHRQWGCSITIAGIGSPLADILSSRGSRSLPRKELMFTEATQFRVVYSEASGFGICVDVTHNTSHNPFPPAPTQNAFANLKGVRCVYHYGLAWYEIRPTIYSGLTVREQLLKLDDQGATSLFDFIMNNAPKPFPEDVAGLSPETRAVGYLDNRR